MSYKVDATALSNIRFNEPELVPSVLQNIAVILSTPKGSVPQYREFGLSAIFLDKPMPAARMMMRAEVREAMGRLSPEERQIVVLSVLEGYAMREIGEILGLPQGTVSSKLHRTLKKLRRMLEDS